MNDLKFLAGRSEVKDGEKQSSLEASTQALGRMQFQLPWLLPKDFPEVRVYHSLHTSKKSRAHPGPPTSHPLSAASRLVMEGLGKTPCVHGNLGFVPFAFPITVLRPHLCYSFSHSLSCCCFSSLCRRALAWESVWFIY